MTDGPTDGWTDGWMDGPMDWRMDRQMNRPCYRDARTHLKSVLKARAPRGLGFFCIVMLFNFMSYNHRNEWMSICLLISLSVSVFVSLSVTHTARDLGRSALLMVFSLFSTFLLVFFIVFVWTCYVQFGLSIILQHASIGRSWLYSSSKNII